MGAYACARYISEMGVFWDGTCSDASAAYGVLWVRDRNRNAEGIYI
jgi:hypothetical protein